MKSYANVVILQMDMYREEAQNFIQVNNDTLS